MASITQPTVNVNPRIIEVRIDNCPQAEGRSIFHDEHREHLTRLLAQIKELGEHAIADLRYKTDNEISDFGSSPEVREKHRRNAQIEEAQGALDRFMSLCRIRTK